MASKKQLFRETVSSRLTDEQKQKLDKLAFDLQLSKSELLRDLIINILMRIV
jgi:hypothetical protein